MRVLVYLFAYLLIFISGLPAPVHAFDCSDTCSFHTATQTQAERLATDTQKILAKEVELDPQWCDALPPSRLISYSCFHKNTQNFPFNLILVPLHVQDHLCPRAPPLQ